MALHYIYIYYIRKKKFTDWLTDGDCGLITLNPREISVFFLKYDISLREKNDGQIPDKTSSVVDSLI